MIEVESHLHYRSQDCLHSSHNEVCCSVATKTVKTQAKVVHWLYESVGPVVVTPFIMRNSCRCRECTSKTAIWLRLPARLIVVPLPCHEGGGIVVRPPPPLCGDNNGVDDVRGLRGGLEPQRPFHRGNCKHGEDHP